MRWEKKLNILGPIEQASRCLETWLVEEGRNLEAKQKQRAAALIARYFQYEAEMTDELMLSFLRHYSNQHEIDMEDPTSVRLEIKGVLDQSRIYVPVNRKFFWEAFLTGMMIASLSLGAWQTVHKKVTRAQQAELKILVHKIVELDPSSTSAAIWAETKQPLQVKSYQDMNWWAYYQSRKILEKRLNSIKRL